MNIRIVICFIIICILPGSFPAAADKVWITTSSGFIASDEILSFENYYIKSSILNNTAASITVFRDKIKIETRVFNINDFTKYDTVGITLLGINKNHSWMSFSKLEENDIWMPAGSTILHWGDSYTIDHFSLNINSMDADSVNLTLSNESIIKTHVLKKDGYLDSGNIRVNVKRINLNGSAELEFFKYNTPLIKAEMLTDKEEYFPDEDIKLTINITSDKILNVAGISLDSIQSIQFKPELISGTGIKGTTSFNSTVTHLPPNSTITITASLECRDHFNRPIAAKISKDILIAPVVSIVKRIPDDTEDNISVELFIYNSEMDTKFIRVRDSIPEGLSVSQQLAWNIDLGPKKSTNITYTASSQSPATYILPSAKALWDGQSASSGTPKINVHMPVIRIIKTAANNEILTDVELEIINSGDRPAIVTLSDNILDGFQLESGNTTWSGFVYSKTSEKIKYSLKGHAVFLPAANATYRDIRGTLKQVESNTVQNIDFSESRKDNTVNTTPVILGQYEITAFMIVSFLAIAGIIGSVTSIVYVIIKFNKRSK